MKKTVFVTPSLKTGGGNRVFVELANQLSNDENREVSIIAPNNSPDKHTFNLSEKVSVLSIGKIASGRLSKIGNIIRTIRYLNVKHGNDTIISSDPLFSIFLCFIKSNNVYRFVQADDYRIFDDGTILGKGVILKIYKKLCIRSYKYRRVRFIFNSVYSYKQYCNDSQRVDTALHLVHPALKLDVFNDKCRMPLTPGDGLRICLVARKHPLKGVINFINVWQDLDSKYRERIKEVLMVSHDDLSCFDTTGINVVVPDSDKDITKAYTDSHIFISTSWWEGFGLPPLEAMSCGCAVICSKAGGVDEYARNETNCLMFEPKNEDELKECLIRMINDKSLRDYLVLNALKTAKQFTWENSAKQLTNIIDHK